MRDIRIGTSGWHYPTGPGRWNGVFYPARRPRGFDELAFYAEYFDFVEVNTTFYGQPRPEVTSAWAARTPSGFLFAVKMSDISTAMMNDKLGNIGSKPEADIVITGDASCLMHMNGGLSRRGSKQRVVHVAEVLAGRI